MLVGRSRSIVPRLDCSVGNASDVCSKLGAASILKEARASACVTACARHVLADLAGNREMARDVTTVDSSPNFPSRLARFHMARVLSLSTAVRLLREATDAGVRWLLCPSM